jgi:hypothetical protein
MTLNGDANLPTMALRLELGNGGHRAASCVAVVDEIRFGRQVLDGARSPLEWMDLPGNFQARSVPGRQPPLHVNLCDHIEGFGSLRFRSARGLVSPVRVEAGYYTFRVSIDGARAKLEVVVQFDPYDRMAFRVVAIQDRWRLLTPRRR